MIKHIDRLLLVGAGKMGSAMLNGWLKAGLNPNGVYVQDPHITPDMAQYLQQNNVAFGDAAPAIFNPEVIILAVKPQVMDAVLPHLKAFTNPKSLFISVAAGKKINSYENILGSDANIIRLMPNTPAAIGDGMSVLVGNKNASQHHKKLALALARTVGLAEYIDDESLMDAVTALSGSGPAYVFHMAEAMTKAGVEAGLPKPLAHTLALQTIKGAGNLMAQSDDHPSILRQNVTSPKGTTAAGLDILMGNNALEKLMIKTIAAAKQRGEELG
ncbi:MAG: pyrroline-5-carboxylate reductase [Alphaproteobacteria bacterium]|nr:pyrroline-5-carboxylate reductase [Alphaproteobacteria bacterium]